MLRASRQREHQAASSKSWNIVVFSIGGVKLAARAEDVGGVASWSDAIPVPSRTPFISAMVKRDDDIMPVYDLGARIDQCPEGEPLLCLVARHWGGPMAICIDSTIPSIRNVETSQIGESQQTDLETLGSFHEEGHNIEIIALKSLGRKTLGSA